MTTINPLATMLGTAFDKLDRNKDGKLGRGEFNMFYEVLKPGVPHDKENRPLVTASDLFKRMDANSDDSVTKSEVLSTGVIMPAELSSDGSIDALLQYLRQLESGTAAEAAALLAAKEDPEKPEEQK